MGIELGVDTGLAILILKPVGLSLSLLKHTLAVILSQALGLIEQKSKCIWEKLLRMMDIQAIFDSGARKEARGFGPKQPGLYWAQDLFTTGSELSPGSRAWA